MSQVKFAPVLLMALAPCFLAGCATEEMTLEQAKAACDKLDGQLVIYYSQKVTLSGIGPLIQTPGKCITNDAFTQPPPAPAIVPTLPP